MAHPIACAAALAVQEIIAEEKLLDNCKNMGEYLSSQLKTKFEASVIAAKHIGEIRSVVLL